MSIDAALRAHIERVACALYEQQRLFYRVPAMAAGVVHDGRIVAFYGHDADPDSMFRIASMTKSFTAAAVLLLRDRGVLQLDAPMASYVPEYAGLTGPSRDAPPITVRQLLSMSSGLATDDPWGDRHLDWTDEELDAVVAAGPLFAIGPLTGFEYSNLGYGLLGRVVLRTTGRRVQDLIEREFLGPLGLRHTVWRAEAAPPGARLCVGMRSDGAGPETILGDGSLAPMGGLWSSAGDLARWIGFFTDAWPPRDDADDLPLRRSSRREMQAMLNFYPPHEVTTVDGATWLQQGGYGMGLQSIWDQTLGEIVSHSGGLPGWGSNMAWVKGTGWGVVALANRTYAPMSLANRRALSALAASGIVRRAAIAPLAELQRAGQALFALLTGWTDAGAGEVFADNVAADLPLEQRRAAAAALCVRHPELKLARIEGSTAAAGRIVAHADASELRIAFSLAPNGRVQKYDLPPM